ncbi:MAG: sensor domain-containing diguanylate cyclase [Candidatus Dormibacteria bacterium]
MLDRTLGTFAGVALTSASVLLGLMLYRLAYVEPVLQRTIDMQVQLSSAVQGMPDQETALRAYVVAGQTTFLEPDGPGLQQTAAAMTALAGDVASDGAALRQFVALSAAQQEWESSWAAPARHLDTGGNVTSFLSQGKTLFDAYRAEAAQVGATVAVAFASTLAISHELVLLAAAVAVAALIVNVVIWLRARRRVAHQVIDPVAHLMTTFDRLAEGRLDVEAPVGGPEEFRAIGEGVNRVLMALRDEREQLLRSDVDLKLANQRLKQLIETARHIAGSLSVRYVLDTVAEGTVGLGAARAVLWVVDPGGHTVRAVHDSAALHGRATGIEPVELGSGLVGRAARYGRWVTGTDGPGGTEPCHACAVPMVVGARIVGVIEALCANAAEEFSSQVLEAFDSLAGHAATAIEAARLYEEADERGRTDPLTGLANRSALNASLEQAMARAEEGHRSLSLAMIDVDNFKRYNDTFGHQAGDDALQEVASLLQQRVRESDTVYRYGGEEIVVLLPGTDLDGAMALMDRIRVAVEARFATAASRGAVTISVGVSEFPLNARSARSLIESADAALYQSKANGRNRVSAAVGRAAPPDPGSPVRLLASG